MSHDEPHTEHMPDAGLEEQRLADLIASLRHKAEHMEGEKKQRLLGAITALEQLPTPMLAQPTLANLSAYHSTLCNVLSVVAELLTNKEMNE